MMACRFYGLFALMALLTAVSGCGHMNPPKRALYQETFATGADAGQVSQVPSAIPAKEAPYVKIISGTAVESLDEAQRKLAEQAASVPGGLEQKIGTLKLRNVTVRTLTELMTEAYDYNVVASRSVADQIIDINLRNISLRAAIESICRLNDLWYREGDGIITLMTREEYVQDVQVRQAPQTRAFFVRYTNAADMAKVIQASMGKEVYLAAIEDEKVYGHIDPEVDLDVGNGDYEPPELLDTRIRKSGGFRSAQTGAAGQAETANPQRYESTFGASAPGEQSRQQEDDEALLAVLTVFKRNNCIVARSLDEGLLNEMGRIIEALDTPTNQVLLEVRILQLNLNDGFESFFEFEYEGGDNTLGLLGTKALGATTLNYLFDNDRFRARIALYEKEGRLEVVSTPFLMAANNSKVEFFVGEETPLRGEVTSETTTIKDTGTTLTTFTQEIEEEELGTDVEMTTFINADGTVTLDFDAEISSPQLAYSTVQAVNDITGEILEYPIDGTTKSEIKAILSARSGQSIAIGGIIRETIDDSIAKVPVLGDIPGVGFFFREVEKTKSKTETVILLTPHVIMHPALAGQVSQEFLGRKSSHEQVTVGRENILSKDE
ncbi:type IV pilus secretin PihL [Syntrophotalea carbinolica DSM 2380]|uniref:Type IV pilus secretin PihL n=1 Tax=Syntrophotalea carbinolica (strain DSM 2380 / NBRC 103641 / GraBd1) TaxID=338963 RepID=Q3A682_SYNC1|nr:type II and III secretion system protein [Syntrophotalea carbinolica]ABA88125.1 type IV pilus secretin PihL [Syntrophotalea carbinolica DSM 2380]